MNKIHTEMYLIKKITNVSHNISENEKDVIKQIFSNLKQINYLVHEQRTTNITLSNIAPFIDKIINIISNNMITHPAMSNLLEEFTELLTKIQQSPDIITHKDTRSIINKLYTTLQSIVVKINDKSNLIKNARVRASVKNNVKNNVKNKNSKTKITEYITTLNSIEDKLNTYITNINLDKKNISFYNQEQMIIKDIVDRINKYNKLLKIYTDKKISSITNTNIKIIDGNIKFIKDRITDYNTLYTTYKNKNSNASLQERQSYINTLVNIVNILTPSSASSASSHNVTLKNPRNGNLAIPVAPVAPVNTKSVLLNKLKLQLPNIIKSVYFNKQDNTDLVKTLENYIKDVETRIEKSSNTNKKKFFQNELTLFKKIRIHLIRLKQNILQLITGKNIVNANTLSKETTIITQFLEKDANVVSDDKINTFITNMNSILNTIHADIEDYFQNIENLGISINIETLFKGSKNKDNREKYYDFMLQYSMQIKNARNAAKLITTNA